MPPAPQKAKPQKARIIAIAGGSGSGKTWLAVQLQAALSPHATRLSLDDFYRDRSHLSPARRANLNFDKPEAIDWASLERVLRKFLAGKPARVPGYDFKTHCRLEIRRTLEPRPLLLLDGLWVLRRRGLRRLFTLGIYIECGARVRLRRRLARDMASRGRTRASIQDQFWTTVEPMHLKHVAPQAG